MEEVANFEPQLGARYTCKLCSQTSNLAEMVCHVIGRKHRQKYVVKHHRCIQKNFALMICFAFSLHPNKLFAFIGVKTAGLGYLGQSHHKYPRREDNASQSGDS